MCLLSKKFFSLWFQILFYQPVYSNSFLIYINYESNSIHLIWNFVEKLISLKITFRKSAYKYLSNILILKLFRAQESYKWVAIQFHGPHILAVCKYKRIIELFMWIPSEYFFVLQTWIYFTCLTVDVCLLSHSFSLLNPQYTLPRIESKCAVLWQALRTFWQYSSSENYIDVCKSVEFVIIRLLLLF